MYFIGQSICLVLLCGLVLLTFVASQADSNVRAVRLRCEYLTNPLGIDVVKPRLSWIVDSPAAGDSQSAWQVVASTSRKNLEKGIFDLWDSGKVQSDQSIQIEYGGIPLKSRIYCYWKVRLWNQEYSAGDWSETAFFSIGLLRKKDWHAAWIGAEKQQREKGLPTIPPSPLLRKTFSSKKIERALLYVTSLGEYEVYINGHKVGDHLLAPEWTDYHKRVQYQTYDVTGMLEAGENCLGAVLADGWYAGRLGPVRWDENFPLRGAYGLDRRLLLQLEIETDRGKQIIISDDSWKLFEDGPIQHADHFLGQVYDARKEQPGWNRVDFDDSAWKSATVDSELQTGELVAQMNEPVRQVATVTPVDIQVPEEGVCIFDMGQNMVGWCRIRLEGKRGTVVTLRHGEMLNADGSLFTGNLGTAMQKDQFILDGKGAGNFEPRFTYHGFRYVEVTGLDQKADKEMLTGIVVASDAVKTGSFECSHPQINQLMQNILWTQRGNMISIPTDCPQRDERMGWMGDALVFAQSAIYNLDMAAFFSKWILDIRDAQATDGRYPDYAPHPYDPNTHFSDAPGWADAGVVVPWRLYQNYGDKRILAEHYLSMKRFIDNIREHNPDHLWQHATGNEYGDWLNGDTITANNYPKSGGQVPYLLYTTAFYAWSTSIFAQIADLLGKEADYAVYSDLTGRIKQKFNQEFVKSDGRLKGDTQAGYALALAFDLLPESLQSKAAQHMVTAVEKYDYRISTGFHSTILLMKQLSRWGYHDIAYRLLENRSFPSWLYSIDQGATTIWERWDAWVEGRGFQQSDMNSFNHYAFGAVAEWIYQNILGIRFDENQPAYKHIILKPIPGGSLTWARGSYQSLHGLIAVEWKKVNSSVFVSVTIPANTEATLYLPTTDADSVLESDRPIDQNPRVCRIEKGKAILQLKSGSYRFKADFD